MAPEEASGPGALYSEVRCTRCGVCCGATDGHPCEHMRTHPDGTTWCDTYENRLGMHRTTTGQTFRCVTIKHLMASTGGYSECAYVKELLRRRGAGG